MYFENFRQAGYDMPTISRMTPEVSLASKWVILLILCVNGPKILLLFSANQEFSRFRVFLIGWS